jgi:1,4-alpha-glucan branching enzyme
MTKKGYFTFVLHSHLPYVLGYGGWPHGTDWLYEAACETYLPLLRIFRGMLTDGITPGVTIGISPVLSEQLADDVFKTGLLDYIDLKTEAARDNEREFVKSGDKAMAALARRWLEEFDGQRVFFTNVINRDIPGAFRELQEEGALEIITCGATHAYFPLVGRDETIAFQLRAAIDSHKRHYGKAPRGIWLPEAAYRPGYKWRYPTEPYSEREPFERKGVERLLAEAGIEYFFVDTHLLEGGEARGVYAARFEGLKRLMERMESEVPAAVEGDFSPRRPYYVGDVDKGQTVCFVRDPETGLTVWSGDHGYPGDGQYLDFHKKHHPGGLRYWRVTSPDSGLGDKERYEPERIAERVAENSDHFLSLVKSILAAETTDEPPILVAPFDTELFGHWWYEGIEWLDAALRKLAADPDIELATAGEYLDKYPAKQVISLPEGSWGEGGFHWIWFNPETEWSWKLFYELEDRLAQIREQELGPEALEVYLKALREFAVFSASDWQFLISTWSARDYAEERLRLHYQNTSRALDIVEKLLHGEALTEEERDFVDGELVTDRLFPALAVDWYDEFG